MLSFQEPITTQRLGPLHWLVVKVCTPRLISMSSAVCLAAASLLALTGCTAVKVKLGMRIYLARLP